MSRRFEQFYRVKRRDDIGQPEYWNKRLDDIDRRIDANENDLEDVNGVADRIEGVALGRISTVITPLVEEVTTRIRTIPAMFAAHSSSNVTIGPGYLTFNIDVGQRNTFAALAYAVVDAVEQPGNGVIGRVVSYDAVDGDLVIDVMQVIGVGAFSSWEVTLSAPPDLVHATRTDNPHLTTAGQVGAYTKQETDQVVRNAVSQVDVSSQFNTIVDGAASDRNTLKKVGTLIDNLAKSLSTTAGSIPELLLKRLRVDAEQGFSSSERARGLLNLGLPTDIGSRGVPSGTVVWFAAPVAPPGYIKANGAMLSRSTYSDLWNYANAYSGVTSEATWQSGYYGYFSSGDGSTNFRIPDLRGMFLRAWDDSRGLNPSGNDYGLYRPDDIKNHFHPGRANSQWYLSVYAGVGNANVLYGDGGTYGYDAMVLGGSSYGGAETRPKHVSLLACIKV